MTTIIFRAAKKQSWDSNPGLCARQPICLLFTQSGFRWLPSSLPAPVPSRSGLRFGISVALGLGSRNSFQKSYQRGER